MDLVYFIEAGECLVTTNVKDMSGQELLQQHTTRSARKHNRKQQGMPVPTNEVNNTTCYRLCLPASCGLVAASCLVTLLLSFLLEFVVSLKFFLGLCHHYTASSPFATLC